MFKLIFIPNSECNYYPKGYKVICLPEEEKYVKQTIFFMEPIKPFTEYTLHNLKKIYANDVYCILGTKNIYNKIYPMPTGYVDISREQATELVDKDTISIKDLNKVLTRVDIVYRR